MKTKTAIILAAGYGKRLLPLTKKIPKPLIKINNITLLDNSINFLNSLDCIEIIINTHYKHKEIEKLLTPVLQLGNSVEGSADILGTCYM